MARTECSYVTQLNVGSAATTSCARARGFTLIVAQKVGGKLRACQVDRWSYAKKHSRILKKEWTAKWSVLGCLRDAAGFEQFARRGIDFLRLHHTSQ